MSREIKFRAWNKEKKIMCYTNEDREIDWWDGVHCTDVEIINNTLNSKYSEYEYMQYVGRKDKNKKEIYEGDIVRCYADTDDFGNDLYFFYKVIWHETYHCWWLSDIYTTEDEYLHQYNPSDIEVIGNIFGNPELLNQ